MSFLIDFLLEKKSPYMPIYSLLPKQMEVLWQYIETATQKK
jgi:hypothetical protein